jgi:DNA processing protein
MKRWLDHAAELELAMRLARSGIKPLSAHQIYRRLLQSKNKRHDFYDAQSLRLHPGHEPGFNVSKAAWGRICQPVRDWENLCELALSDGWDFMLWGDANYPALLNQIPDPPNMLWYKGKISSSEKSLAVVGTRKCSTYGPRILRQIIAALSPFKPLIVSGLAAGLDTAAHVLALEQQLPTYAVLAHGPQSLYPAQNRDLARQIGERGGALLCEMPWGVPARAMMFPRRNRIIAGVAQACLVVESAENGGSMITAALARDYHREVWAVPGSMEAPESQGCLKLIAEHSAQILHRIEQIPQNLCWRKPEFSADQVPRNSSAELAPLMSEEIEGLSEAANQVLSLIRSKGQVGSNDLMKLSELDHSVFNSVLLELEFHGLQRRDPMDGMIQAI